MFPLLAMQSLPPPGYGPIVFMIAAATVIAGAIMIITHLPLKYLRHGRVKDTAYESGMEPIGDARGRFNVRFYLVAMLFLLFDVELIFMYPWAVVFFDVVKSPEPSPGWAGLVAGPGGVRPFLFFEMVIFLLILLVGYVYAWRKGIFRWE
ncbi:MAG: NADH-quinone oxidoreductase subunit A [Phycisphaerae bacterium]|nr:NADH-quinone oxidoreductase subunit A [Phycisphaerae bacterium]